MKRLIIILLLPLLSLAQEDVDFLKYLGKPIDSLPIKNFEDPSVAFMKKLYRTTGDFEFLGITYNTLDVITSKISDDIMCFTFTLEETFNEDFFNRLKDKYPIDEKRSSDLHKITEMFRFDVNDRVIQDPALKHANCPNGKPLNINYFFDQYRVTIRCNHEHLFRPPAMQVSVAHLEKVDPLSYIGKNINDLPQLKRILYLYKDKQYETMPVAQILYANKEAHTMMLYLHKEKKDNVKEVSLLFFGALDKNMQHELNKMLGKPKMYSNIYSLPPEKIKPEYIVKNRNNVVFDIQVFDIEDADLMVWKHNGYVIMADDLIGGLTLKFFKEEDNYTPF
ncbi:hypothetical protein M0D21_16075 [Aquimarina sp. D1M17]|uniref:hypothetical protein n=1 Tax=Aquimarina acroporae TaxID=2937283 RepID=UPI0020BE9CE4|nr:hypothetical protein [Aquimarina acroporae]MCK8523096.1 hypothetical protein [Aquimarina acroporae]